MSFDFTKYKEIKNLIPLELPDKKAYYTDLVNLEDSWTGRMDAQLANTFIQEAVQLIINAIVVFEQGYLDCAYYSLRQSIEVSTTMVYLTELEPDMKTEELQKWRTKSKFPMYGQMIKFLDKNGNAFSDIREKMKNYFDELQKVKESMNKYVHKQGFDTFYVARRHSAKVDTSALTKDFEDCLISCIGAIAVFRLAIDPLPVLLMDSEIYSRTGDLLTESYSDDFVYKYVGQKAIEAYKQTEIYHSFHEYFMNKEQMKPCVLDVTKFQHIDNERINEILNQAHLLTRTDYLAVVTVGLSKKIASLYFSGGWPFYTTNTKSVRYLDGFDSDTFKKIKESENHMNNRYDEAYLSYLNLDSEELYLEHNEQFEPDEFIHLKAFVIALVLIINQSNSNNERDEVN
ncbi:hypothetical protein A7K91_00130 [Paenibacillus oryzae]|uniref:Uncharacterized protein n=1 Tax=Paenibacillus oryzae TaxID=1844972 RepID=A0A1A5YM67_9BACL|nr:hypothetical protein [Paenibacillus oryzae]OBR66726.1 hypothetical protein A7K91_00130 [Paenibacillus oryzae]